MRDSDGRIGRVDALAARPGGAKHVDAKILVLDLDVDLFGLGKHRDGGGGRMNASLDLGLWDALHSVNARLPPQLAVFDGPMTLNMTFNSAEVSPERHDLDAPAARSQKRVYMRKRSAANSAASSPPVPARSSVTALRSNSGSRGTKSGVSEASSFAIVCSRRDCSARASVAISGSSIETSSRTCASSSSYFCSSAAIATIGIDRLCSRPSSRFSGIAQPGRVLSARSTSSARASAAAKRSRSASEPQPAGGGELLAEALDTTRGVHEALLAV